MFLFPCTLQVNLFENHFHAFIENGDEILFPFYGEPFLSIPSTSPLSVQQITISSRFTTRISNYFTKYMNLSIVIVAQLHHFFVGRYPAVYNSLEYYILKTETFLLLYDTYHIYQELTPLCNKTHELSTHCESFKTVLALPPFKVISSFSTKGEHEWDAAICNEYCLEKASLLIQISFNKNKIQEYHKKYFSNANNLEIQAQISYTNQQFFDESRSK